MVRYTASEIIQQAKFLANVRNTNLTDFFINCNLLNSLYKDIYQDIINNSNQFVETIQTSATQVELEDVYKVVYVGYENGGEIPRSSLRVKQPNCYYIENNSLIMPPGNKVIRICPLPTTITCPDSVVEYSGEVDPSTVSAYTNYAVTEDGEIVAESRTLVFVTEDEVIPINFENPPDWMKREGKEIDNIHASGNYCFVSYSDNRVRLYSSPEYFTEWTPWKGKVFRGRIIAFEPNEDTGKGVVFWDWFSKKYYFASFVPDTILEFPTNAPFTLLIYRLAAILASLVGLENPYLTNDLISQAEIKFYQSLSKGQATRVANIRGGY